MERCAGSWPAMGQGAARGEGPSAQACSEQAAVAGHTPGVHAVHVPRTGSEPMVPTVLPHTFWRPTMVAALPLVHVTALRVLSAAKVGVGKAAPSLQWKEKLEMVEPGHVISKGPTREDTLPLA